MTASRLVVVRAQRLGPHRPPRHAGGDQPVKMAMLKPAACGEIDIGQHLAILTDARALDDQHAQDILSDSNRKYPELRPYRVASVVGPFSHCRACGDFLTRPAASRCLRVHGLGTCFGGGPTLSEPFAELPEAVAFPAR